MNTTLCALFIYKAPMEVKFLLPKMKTLKIILIQHFQILLSPAQRQTSQILPQDLPLLEAEAGRQAFQRHPRHYKERMERHVGEVVRLTLRAVLQATTFSKLDQDQPLTLQRAFCLILRCHPSNFCLC